MSIFRALLRMLALRGHEEAYRRFYHPNGKDWADMLRQRGDFRKLGEDCYIDPWALIEGRKLICIGNNVRIATSAMFCHDGSVNMINRAYGLKLDNVGPIDIRDNVYIGYGSIILPGATIGPNAIVTAGSVVRSNVGEGDVVAGIPARRVGRLDLTVQILRAKNQKYPWRHLIEQRTGDWNSALEPELLRLRTEYFYGRESTD